MYGDTERSFSYDDLESVLGGMGDGFVLTNAQGFVTYMNRAAEDIFEYRHKPGKRLLFMDICRLINLETKERYFCPVTKSIKENRTVGLSKNVGIMHGELPVYLSATCSPRHDNEGNIIGSTSVFRDISRIQRLARKVENDQYYMRSVFEAAKIGICSLDVRGEIVELNEAALETLGGTYHDAIGKQLGDVFKCEASHPCGCGRDEKCKFCIIRNNLEAAVLDDGFSAEFVAAVVSRVQAEPIWLQFFLTQVWKENEKQIVLTMIDISKRKQRERELTEARRMAEAANNTKTQFLANMSHEIRTPINGMTGMINLTLRTALNEEQRSNLQAAKQCSEDLLQIINDILDYAKLENGKMAIEKIDLDLHALLKRVSTLHGQVAADKGLRFISPDRDGLPRFIQGDPLRLRQILHNLLNNALKFTSSGFVKLGAGTFKRGIKSLLEFYVEDTGIGISPEAQEKLFKPFSQVDGSITRCFGGTGLGLMIVKELVTAMDGEIHVTSKPGAGSRFTFTIPLVLADKADRELKDQSVFVNPYWEKKRADREREAEREDSKKADKERVWGRESAHLPEPQASGNMPDASNVSGISGVSGMLGVSDVSDISNVSDVFGEEQPDDDILDLLKYCEDKLNS